jgi:ATP-binding cassette subfamily F protein 3
MIPPAPPVFPFKEDLSSFEGLRKIPVRKKMNLLQLQRGTKHFGTKVLFDGASFSINEGEHVGVIGPNGAGKTTLFKILVGQETLDSGEITKAQGLRIGYLEQEAEWTLDQTSEEYLAQNCLKPLWELKKLGLELGLAEEHFQIPLRRLSGGYRMRMKLLDLIGQEPNLMLLDEPTNFLDLESVLALETFLQDYKGSFLLISHDREFLRRTTESTLEVEAGDITKFPGHIDDYFEQKAQLREVLASQAANLEAKRKHIQDFIDRFRAKATKARQAQSRMKQLERMGRIEIADLPVRAKIKIPEPIHTGKESLALLNADLGYGANRVLRDVNLRLERGAHLGVVGHNGAGKSTLLKSLAGQLPLLKGEYKLGYQVTLSLFAQHTAEQLNLNDTVLDCLQKAAHVEITAQEILNVAGSLLFSGDDIHKRVRTLSGGEKSRVALGQVLLKKSPLLLMDEPTNHLDFETVEALTEALRDYAGTVVVVSHDRGFIGRIASQILEIHDGRVDLYPGTYDDYVWSLQRGALREREARLSAEGPPVARSTPTNSSARSSGGGTTGLRSGSREFDSTTDSTASKFNYYETTKRLQGEIKELQRKIRKCEELLFSQGQRRDELTHELLGARGPQAESLSKELSACSAEIERLEGDLLTHMENLDAKERELAALKGE